MSPLQTRSLRRLACLAGLGLLAAPSLPANVEPIVPPAKRAEVLERARRLLGPKEMPATPANPFFSETFNAVRLGGSGQTQSDTSTLTPAPAGPKSARDLLEAIATSLKPSGYFVFGGEPTLVFGQKRVKAGGLLTIGFEGKEYTLEVTAVDRTHFTLRLNREEFTRPIK
jgi:hypothetical protein